MNRTARRRVERYLRPVSNGRRTLRSVHREFMSERNNRFMKHTTMTALAAALATIATTGTAFAAYPGDKYAAKAHVPITAARTIALKTVHGTIVSQELEYEAGGSGLRYTFDIKTPAGVREVGVDARDGAMLENIAEEGTSAHKWTPEKGKSDGENSAD